jgi:hypothetical protein
MRAYLRSLSCLVFTGTVIGGILAAAPLTAAGAAATTGTATCSGTPSAPGVLTGTHGSVVVRGACEVNAGAAVVNGDLTLSPGSALLAAFALNDKTGTGTSSLTVKGNVLVRAGATLLMGCNPANFPCLDDPNQNKPTLSMHPTVGLDLRSNQPLGVIVHNFTVGGDVIQTGGGGGVNCNPQGVFKLFQSPVYSTYEVGSVGGDVRISSVHSCWMGLVELHVGNTVVMHANLLADPDAIEILSNNIMGNLICRGNSRTWDSADAGPHLFPRIPQPNTVGRNRKGQCVLSSPTKPGGKPGPGPF